MAKAIKTSKKKSAKAGNEFGKSKMFIDLPIEQIQAKNLVNPSRRAARPRPSGFKTTL